MLLIAPWQNESLIGNLDLLPRVRPGGERKGGEGADPKVGPGTKARCVHRDAAIGIGIAYNSRRPETGVARRRAGDRNIVEIKPSRTKGDRESRGSVDARRNTRAPGNHEARERDGGC